MGRRRSGRSTLLSGSSSGRFGEGRAVLLFGGPPSADAFRAMEGLGTEWEVIGHRPAGALVRLQTSAANGISYAEIEPPGWLIRAQDASRLVPLGGIVNHLWGVARGEMARSPITAGAEWRERTG